MLMDKFTRTQEARVPKTEPMDTVGGGGGSGVGADGAGGGGAEEDGDGDDSDSSEEDFDLGWRSKGI
jgi:hypothetical protein